MQRRQCVQGPLVALAERAVAQQGEAGLEQVEGIGRPRRRPVRHRLGRQLGAIAHQLLHLEDAPLVALVGRLEQRPGLQAARLVDVIVILRIDGDRISQPHRPGRCAHGIGLAGRDAGPGRAAHDPGTRHASAHLGDGALEGIEQGHAVAASLHLRQGEEGGFAREVEPGRGRQVAIARRQLPHKLVELLAALDDVAVASQVHRVQRREVDRGATGERAQVAVLGARRAGKDEPRQRRASADAHADDAHSVRPRPARRSSTKAAASRHGSIVQNERARPDGEASTKATAPSSSAVCRP